MSTKVVPAPASRAKRPANGTKPQKQAEQQAVNEAEARLKQGDSETEVGAASKQEVVAESVQSETSTTEFTFGAALAEAAASSSLLVTEAEKADKVGFGEMGDGSGGTILLIGAIALVALGVVVLVSDGGSKNEAPTITAPAAATTAEDTAITIAAPATTDPDGDAVTVTATATGGAVVKNANGSFTFTPAANSTANGVITYTVTDPDGLTATATQTITVTAVDDPATAGAAVNLAVTEDTPATGTASITDPDGPAIVYAVGTQGTKGTAAVTAAGAVTYTPSLNATGTDTFTITGGGVAQTFNVSITAVNDAPNLGPDQTFNIVAGATLTGALLATDVDSTTLTYGVGTAPTSGTLAVTPTGALTYTPNAGFTGTDTFVVNVSDGATPTAGTDTETITVVVAAAPTATVADNATGTLQLSGSGGNIDFSDNVTLRTDVVIINFTTGDEILVDHPTNAAFDARSSTTGYSYTANNVSGAAVDDIVITFNSGGNFTQIVLVDAAINANGGPNFVFDYASARDSMGFDFITVV